MLGQLWGPVHPGPFLILTTSVNSMRLTLAALAFSFWLLSLGCGGSTETTKPLDEAQQVASLLTEFIDSSPATIGNYFVGKQKVSAADFKKYVSMTYELDGKPNISGDTATANVKMKSSDGKELGIKEWSFAKEGGKWKLKSAPMP
jgi:hypothetical protein